MRSTYKFLQKQLLLSVKVSVDTSKLLFMASSDEEGEIVPNCITNYHFVDSNGGVASFSILPLQWGEDDKLGALNSEIFLRGTADDGLQPIYKKVLAWRFELSYALPEIHVLSKDKIWIKLLKPRNGYVDTIRSVLITVHFLHFVKKNPEGIVWNYIEKSLSAYEVLPSKDDLLEHMPTIKEAARRDKDLSNSKSFDAFILETSRKRIHSYECNQAKKRPRFIIETNNDADSGGDDDAIEDEQFDHVCALCDDGGELLWGKSLVLATRQSRPSCAEIANINDTNVLLVACWGLLTN
uniref:RFTS domain-containing protein n=1 Tax=Solanum lycopersicum TaxID=4081 RepID=A0A3Q7IHD5_SOLLC